MLRIKTYKTYFIIKKNLEISFQNEPEHEITFLKVKKKKIVYNLSIFSEIGRVNEAVN